MIKTVKNVLSFTYVHFLVEVVDPKGKSRPLHVFLFNDVLIGKIITSQINMYVCMYVSTTGFFLGCQSTRKTKSLMLSRKSATKPFKFLFKLDIGWFD
jgi:hypothetical protein